MNKTAILAVKIISDAAGVTNGFKKTDTAAGGLSKRALAVKAGLLAVAAAGVKIGKDAVKSFQTAGGEVNAFKRVLGLSAEDASRLRFQLKMTGVDGATGAKSMTIFTKNIVKMSEADKAGKIKAQQKADAIRGQIKALDAAGPKTKGYADKMAYLKGKLADATTASKMNVSALGSLGIKYTDAHGKMIPMTTLLPQVADKFAKMKDGPEKSALAMKLFGKSGTAMIPFLNKGAAGLAELSAKSDKYGQTLTGGNLDAIKANKAAQRDWSAALEGVQIQLGAQLLPMLTVMATTLTSQLIPGIVGTSKYLSEHADTVGIVLGVVGGLFGLIKTISTVTRLWTAAQAILNVVMAANPIMLIVLAVAALTAGFIYLWNTNVGFRNFFIGAWAAIQAAAGAVAAWFTGSFLPALTSVWNGLIGGVTWLWTTYIGIWVTIIRFMIGIPGRILGAVSRFVTLLVTAGRNLLTGMLAGITAGWRTVAGWLGGLAAKITGAVGDGLSWLKSAGENVVRGLWNGISGSYEWIKGKIESWVGNVVDFFKRVFGIKSPSTVMEKLIGRQLPAGIGRGVDRNMNAALNPIRKLSKAVQAAFAPELDLGSVGGVSDLSRLTAGSRTSRVAQVVQQVTIELNGTIVDRRATAKDIRDLLNEEARFTGRVAIAGSVI